MIPKAYPVADGIRLSACRTDRFKSGTLSLSAVLPIDQKATPLTTLLLSVLRRGTERFPSLADINRRLDYLYGTELAIRNFYRGDNQIIGFSAELLDGSYLPKGEDLIAPVLEVISQILFAPLTDENGLLCEKYVESEKQLQCDTVRAQKNDPRSYASERLRNLLYENEPCGASVFGTEEQIMALTPADLTAHYKKLLASLTLDCFYVGPANPADIAAALKAEFASKLAGKPSTDAAAVPLVPMPLAERRFEEELPVSQGQLLLAYRTGTRLCDKQFYAVSLCNEMLGLSPVSKLFVHVRERLSLCYYCASRYNAYKGVITVQCALDPANRALAEKEIRAQVAAMAAGDFTDAELAAAKSSMRNAYRQIEDSPAALEGFYFGRALMGVHTTAEESRLAFDAVGREAIIAAARTLVLDTVYFLNGTLAGKEETEDDTYDE